MSFLAAVGSSAMLKGDKKTEMLRRLAVIDAEIDKQWVRYGNV